VPREAASRQHRPPEDDENDADTEFESAEVRLDGASDRDGDAGEYREDAEDTEARRPAAQESASEGCVTSFLRRDVVADVTG